MVRTRLWPLTQRDPGLEPAERFCVQDIWVQAVVLKLSRTCGKGASSAQHEHDPRETRMAAGAQQRAAFTVRERCAMQGGVISERLRRWAEFGERLGTQMLLAPHDEEVLFYQCGSVPSAWLRRLTLRA